MQKIPEIVKVYTVLERGGFGILHRVLLKDGSHAARKTFEPKNGSELEPRVLDKLRTLSSKKFP